MWFIIAFFSFFLLALAAVIDKILLTKSKIVPLSYAFYGVFLGALVSTCFLIFSSGFYFPKDHIIPLIIGGSAFYFGLYFLYLSVQKSEISKVNPLIISITPLMVFVLALFLAIDLLSNVKLLGIILIILSSYFLSQVGLPKTRLGYKSWTFLLITCLMFALSNVFSKVAYNELSFITAFVWLRWFSLGAGLVFTIILNGWSAIFTFREKKVGKTQKKILAFVVGQVAGGLGVILMQYAISLGSVTLVTALNGLQFFLVMLIVYLSSKFYPTILKENIAGKYIIRKTVWSLILFCGVVLILI